MSWWQREGATFSVRIQQLTQSSIQFGATILVRLLCDFGIVTRCLGMWPFPKANDLYAVALLP